MAMFDYNDTVYLLKPGRYDEYLGKGASVIAIFDDRERWVFPELPEGIVYSIEFENGDAIDVHEGEIAAECPE
jgi:hypothetical protein